MSCSVNSCFLSISLSLYLINNSILTIHLDKPYIGKIPIKVVSNEKQKEVIKLVNAISELNEQLIKYSDKDIDKKQELTEQLNKTNEKINNLIYEFYEITEEEKKIIEESLT